MLITMGFLPSLYYIVAILVPVNSIRKGVPGLEGGCFPVCESRVKPESDPEVEGHSALAYAALYRRSEVFQLKNCSNCH